ncbi:putative mitochondrial RNA polymerase II [Leptomonas pyrrhocoris]|uniref:RNA uridylyltransferase n=1 Tax=Leptomonas pyrrhocoris TaxID=157538 RepID=A0A0N0VEH8_LEPPY|nr:putative mitochondrial RNA polymerase II [Leptomonas pyrrhocoris]KPA78402.1 putative mitochondrial RNA polymerase II [Leptomonas pyrrhocoris]|eukprot:XP_015656841.1 putative mitochondrial RNA polymerase II [Leptomonas pyrrhocoris]
MASTAAQLSSKLLTQQGYLKVLEQRKWLQNLLHTFTLEADKSVEKPVASPIVLPYGSIISGTSFRDGDADYAVVFSAADEIAHKYNNVVIERERQEKVLADLFSHIRQNNSSVDLQPQRIFRARMPIVQYVRKSPEGDSKFDLSLSIDGLKNTLLLRSYMVGDPRLRLGILCAKQWGREHQVLNARRGWISPYALTIMYIYFMKATGRTQLYISEDDIAERVKVIVDIVGGTGGKLEDVEEFASILPFDDVDTSIVQQDVHEFFNFYGDPSCFDFDVSVVDIRSRDRFATKDEWCEAIKDLGEEDRWHLLGHENVLLRDPFEPHSLGRSVDFFRGEEMREKFRTAALKRDALSFLSPA